MTSVDIEISPARATATRRTGRRRPAYIWWLFCCLLVVTVIVLIPVVATVLLSLGPSPINGNTAAVSLTNYIHVIGTTNVLGWLGNSLIVTIATVAVAIAVAAPAGYVVSRARGRWVSSYSLVLFVVQSLPVVTAIIPLFVLFAGLGLIDSLVGLTIVYVGSTMSVAIWMMAAYFDSIPASIEEAAWMDGCSVFGGFVRVVLRNAFPGLLSTGIFSFLLAWNDYLVASVFLRSSPNFTLPLGLETFFQQYATDWGSVMAVAVIMLLPPVLLFAFLNKYFSVGGIGGSLAGR